MAIALVNAEWSEEATPNDFRINIVNFKGDTAYPTGGSTGVAGRLGFAPGRLRALVPISHGGYTWDYDTGTDKLKVYQQSAATGALTEVPNNANLSGVTFRALVIAEQ